MKTPTFHDKSTIAGSEQNAQVGGTTSNQAQCLDQNTLVVSLPSDSNAILASITQDDVDLATCSRNISNRNSNGIIDGNMDSVGGGKEALGLNRARSEDTFTSIVGVARHSADDGDMDKPSDTVCLYIHN